MNTATQRAPGDLAAIVSGLGLSIKSEFVPFSKSRNAKEKHKTLNWKVTLYKDGREIIRTDYSAGVAHCPAYKASIRALGGRNSIMHDEAIAQECESGKAVRTVGEGTGYMFSGKPIEPNALDVIYSLLMDADALNEFSYEDWAANTGYDPDSRKGEALYRSCLEIALKLRTCLEIALKLRNGLGEKALAELREAFQDY